MSAAHVSGCLCQACTARRIREAGGAGAFPAPSGGAGGEGLAPGPRSTAIPTGCSRDPEVLWRVIRTLAQRIEDLERAHELHLDTCQELHRIDRTLAATAHLDPQGPA